MSNDGNDNGSEWQPRAPLGDEVAPPGNTRAQKHGALSARAVRPLAQQHLERLTLDAPWTQAPPHRRAAEAYAWAEAQADLLRGWLDENGMLDDDGKPRPACDLLERIERKAASARTELGLGPLSQAKLLVALGSIDGPAAIDALEALKAAGRATQVAIQQRALDVGSTNGSTESTDKENTE